MAITEQPVALFNSLASRYESLSNRDQLALKCLATFAAVMIVIYWLIIPVATYSTKAQLRYQDTSDTLSWMQQNASVFKTLSQVRTQRTEGESLLGIANKTSKSYGLSFKRYQPVDENGLTLWLENISFNSLMMWLERLEKKHGVVVTDIVVDGSKQSDIVNVRIFLQG